MYRSPRLNLLLSATALSLIASAAHALPLGRYGDNRPSIEVNLSALRELRAGGAPQNVAPETPISVTTPPKAVWQEGPPGQILPEALPEPKPIKAPPVKKETAPAEPKKKDKKEKAPKHSAAESKPVELKPSRRDMAPPPPPPPPQERMMPPPLPPGPPPADMPSPPPRADMPTPPPPESHGMPEVSLPATTPPPAEEPKLLGQMSDSAPVVPPAAEAPATPPAPPAEPNVEIAPAVPEEAAPAPAKKESMLSGIKKWFGSDEKVKPADAPAPETAPVVEAAPAAPPAPEPEAPKAVELTPPPAPAPAAEAPAEDLKNKLPEQQLASVPPPSSVPAASAAGEPAQRIMFVGTDTVIPTNSRDTLNQLADRLKKEETLRVSVVAHASSTGDQASTARRISLARALAVRAYLIDRGVDNLRINVQAEGAKNGGEQPDRVDLFLLTPTKG